jgi:hypothetical protein
MFVDLEGVACFLASALIVWKIIVPSAGTNLLPSAKCQDYTAINGINHFFLLAASLVLFIPSLLVPALNRLVLYCLAHALLYLALFCVERRKVVNFWSSNVMPGPKLGDGSDQIHPYFGTTHTPDPNYHHHNHPSTTTSTITIIRLPPQASSHGFGSTSILSKPRSSWSGTFSSDGYTHDLHFGPDSYDLLPTPSFSQTLCVPPIPWLKVSSVNITEPEDVKFILKDAFEDFIKPPIFEQLFGEVLAMILLYL